jgi:hypothetical protein
MLTDVPVGPLVGVKVEIVGADPTVTVNGDALVAVPSGVVTAIEPVVAPMGTVAVIWTAESTVNESPYMRGQLESSPRVLQRCAVALCA